MDRCVLLSRLAEMISGVRCGHPVRVGIDGVDAAGKTTLADELVRPLVDRGRPVVRASVDGFHLPRARRMRRGAMSGEGYYRDSFDHARLIGALLAPLGRDGDLRIRRSVFDHRADSAVEAPLETVARDAVLLFDGVFLHRPELRAYWDFTVFVRVGFDVSTARAETRDVGLFGSARKVRARYRERYVPGQRIYLREVDPERHASVVVDNEAPSDPTIVGRFRDDRA